MSNIGDVENIDACYELERKWKVLRELKKEGFDISHYWADDVDPEISIAAHNNFEKASAEEILKYRIGHQSLFFYNLLKRKCEKLLEYI